MKKYILILWIALLSISCGEGFLNESPSASIPAGSDFSAFDIQKLVNGIYASIASASYYGAPMFYYGDVKGDDMQAWTNSRTPFYMYIYEQTANNPNSGGLWGQPWYVIRNANNVLDAIKKSTQIDPESDEIRDYKGHALATRALAHFDLLRIYGYPYAKDQGASLGIPLVDHVIDAKEVPPIRSTVAQSFDFIINDLQTAIPLLSTAKNNGQMNAYAARALLARVYLYCEKNKEAFETARDLIEEIKSNGQYQLASHDKYIEQFSLESKFDSESLYEVAFSATDNLGRDGLAYLIHWWGYYATVVTKDFIDVLNEDPDDVRWGIVGNGGGCYYLTKYPGAEYDLPSYENNYVVFRLSEVYLIAAEAGLKAGRTYRSAALGYLNDIVSRANPGKSVSDAEFDLDRVLKERRKELIGEGHRYFDALRNGKTMSRSGGWHLTNHGPDEMNWDNHKCVLPLPKEQFQMNPKMQQNPGYARE